MAVNAMTWHVPIESILNPPCLAHADPTCSRNLETVPCAEVSEKGQSFAVACGELSCSLSGLNGIRVVAVNPLTKSLKSAVTPSFESALVKELAICRAMASDFCVRASDLEASMEILEI
ncbi:hypothetical protein CRG98_031535 [Punica granatum]|uniref:Uncharacterized protein n=1 Tax=Punica granatum TaxID=22663 RepID=A0A2I0IVP7_PUNGR|nr:hypothetical protein CRG98_031535 [Punica granatum]